MDGNIFYDDVRDLDVDAMTMLETVLMVSNLEQNKDFSFDESSPEDRFKIYKCMTTAWKLHNKLHNFIIFLENKSAMRAK